MSKILRKAAQLFGSTAGPSQIAKFGSLAASAPVLYSGATADPDNIQALGNWLQGWFAGVEGASSPAIEDMNGFCYVMAYQIAYAMQTGVPEWNSTTVYYIGSIVQDGSANLYYSLTNSNTNNAVSDTTKWGKLATLLGNTRVRPVTTNGTDPGLGGVSMCANVSAVVITATTPTDVTGLSTILTTGGNPVKLRLQAGATNNSDLILANSSAVSAVSGILYFLRGSTTISAQTVGFSISATATNTTILVPPSTFAFTDNVAAGTYTYKVQFSVAGANMSGSFNNFQLVADES